MLSRGRETICAIGYLLMTYRKNKRKKSRRWYQELTAQIEGSEL